MSGRNWTKARDRDRMRRQGVEQYDAERPMSWADWQAPHQPPKPTGILVRCLKCRHRGRLPEGAKVGRMRCSACGHRQGGA